jgi:hypothetical protein
MTNNGRAKAARVAAAAAKKFELRAAAGCRWGAGCDEAAGHGTFGQFCAKHAALLQSTGSAAGVTPAPAKRPRRKPVSALDLARHIQENGTCTREMLADALDISPRTVSRVAALARDHGWISATGGTNGGLVPGNVTPPTNTDN